MLIPRFSLRQLLGIIAGCAVVFFVASLAIRGQTWAVALSVTVLALVVFFLVCSLLYFVNWLIYTAITAIWRPTTLESPFADTPPEPPPLFGSPSGEPK